ncbi:hypothetical protein CPLU01_08124 [Colletotrichum plurivorum]|uniref:Alpha-L-rhamnosidase six-hairpin glycosidase domain-containing protein n=1 Tax=Colletotrichum plurivorum TaxID=2175906 RepID=A0A8H6NE19_9PEZI|nr:hypothetical protein CPLU01_08124 [Colletotrichum plurivorum]
MIITSLLLLAAAAAPVAAAADNSQASDPRIFSPRGVAVGRSAALQTQPFATFTLTPENPVATLDYGVERAGFPVFEVSAVSGGPAQIEVKYTEHFDGLSHPFADGPYTFSNQLGNSFRVETFAIATTGRFSSPLLQGGQRWQSVRLLTNETTDVTFSSVGFEATIDVVEPEDLPGRFHSDDETLNEIWKLGARAAIAACVEKGSQRAIWEVDEENGVIARSVRPSLTWKATSWTNYTIEFDTKIKRGGSWWAMGAAVAGNGYTLLLTGELPESSRFANVNTTLTPPNTISLAYGPDFVNQTTLNTYHLGSYKVPFPVKEDTWYHISTAMSPSGHLSVSINDTQVLNVSRSDHAWLLLASPAASYSGTPAFTGSFGFGAYQDHAAYFRNARAFDTANGSELYSNNLTSRDDVLAEYGTRANYESVCLDGPKRDRLVWLGDFYHTARISAVSTSQTDRSRGTLQLLLDSQIANGQMNISPNLGYDLPAVASAFAPSGAGGFGLQDYQLLGLMAFNDHIRLTNDLDWARETWPRWQRVVEWLLPQVNSTTGLVSFDNGFGFTGPVDGGSAISCEAVEALNGVADVASTLGDTTSADRYRGVAAGIAAAVNERLWNDEAGAYGYSLTAMDDISVAGTAFCITSGVASRGRAARSVTTVSRLRLGPGYKDTSLVSSNDSTVNISPNTNGFLLEAMFAANATQVGKELITSLWGAMLPGNGTEEKDRSAVGTSWEYVNAATEQPGLGLFTSLSHPWGGAATYVLTEWAAGVRAADGVDGFGYRNWVVAPAAGVEMGLKTASASVVTAFGGNLSAEWRVEGSDMFVSIRGPIETRGKFVFAGESISLHGRSVYEFHVDASLEAGIV